MKCKLIEEKLLLTNKSIALMAAIESDLLPKVEGGWDDTKFQIFWEKYETYLKVLSNQNGSKNR